MKILLATLNSKFIHSSLALRYIRAFCGDRPYDINLREFTINDSLAFVTGEIYREKPDIVAFSTYIWNINETLAVARRLKQVMGDVTVILGGPEVTFEAAPLMERHPFIDFVVKGEGEITFKELLEFLVEGKGSLHKIKGILFRQGNKVEENPDRELIKDLDIIPFPYCDDEDLANKIVYFEASRGCPFKCQYCLSSTIKGVRYFSLERVKRDLGKLIEMGVKQVKFVDRTFNCNSQFSAEIFKFLLQKRSDTTFHFEISADLLDRELLDILREAPPGFFQFEIGVQTTNPSVLEEIQRNSSLERLFNNVREVKGYNNIHQHMDLIAGLPGEDMDSFRKSFDDVFRVRPDMLQLGFLKLIKGSGIRNRSRKYGYIYTEEPPYEVLANRWMGYRELLRLKMVEELLEYYYNSHRFDNTIEHVLKIHFDSPFDFFQKLAEYWEEAGLHRVKHSPKRLYTLLYNFLVQRLGLSSRTVRELLKLDFLLFEKALVLPPPLKKIEIPLFKQRCYDFLNNPENIEKYLPDYRNLSPKKVFKMVHFEAFHPLVLGLIHGHNAGEGKDVVVLLFDYMNRDKIRGKAKLEVVEI